MTTTNNSAEASNSDADTHGTISVARRNVRKQIRVKYSNGAENIFTSYQLAQEETGHTIHMLMRFCATGDPDDNGDVYTLVDYEPKPQGKRACTVGVSVPSAAEAERITKAAETEGMNRSKFCWKIIKAYIDARAT